MLIISAPLMTDKISALLDGYNKDGVTFKFLGKKGMDLQFEATGISGYEATSLAKSIIRDTDFGEALYFGTKWKD